MGKIVACPTAGSCGIVPACIVAVAEEYGIAVKKGNTELLDKINAAIQSMLDSGKIGEISAQYLDAETEDGADSASNSDAASATEPSITEVE